MKEAGETRKSVDDYQVGEGVYRLPTMEDLEKHEQVSDRMGYNPTDKYVGEHRSPATHSQDLAGRFLQFLRDKDARAIETIRETRPDPDRDMANLPDYLRWVGEQGEEEARRRETGLPLIRRRDPERLEQADKAMQARNRSLKDAEYKLLRDKMGDESLSSLGEVETASRDLMSRVFGRRLSRDLPYTNR